MLYALTFTVFSRLLEALLTSRCSGIDRPDLCPSHLITYHLTQTYGVNTGIPSGAQVDCTVSRSQGCDPGLAHPLASAISRSIPVMPQRVCRNDDRKVHDQVLTGPRTANNFEAILAPHTHHIPHFDVQGRRPSIFRPRAKAIFITKIRHIIVKPDA